MSHWYRIGGWKTTLLLAKWRNFFFITTPHCAIVSTYLRLDNFSLIPSRFHPSEPLRLQKITVSIFVCPWSVMVGPRFINKTTFGSNNSSGLQRESPKQTLNRSHDFVYPSTMSKLCTNFSDIFWDNLSCKTDCSEPWNIPTGSTRFLNLTRRSLNSIWLISLIISDLATSNGHPERCSSLI